ncbi:hypothetical protein TpMuguga_01g00640 [Theileria parva strain Muguga]|uniref:Uncharacterized protein n=1 Tax=Theileria parva TaxID=5875 RepID=Q4N830_THEPA|nr:uncharacterized protein TpMuguga_01g00640 [Theileria parva strain Muguga]EAN33878.1 hypothetical protein TpMuguga_01g00640 [Theileria parva strain Muguga]|eukprot:XP_766161.1 hypothetical protein [Theileria parva strain Muguga]
MLELGLISNKFYVLKTESEFKEIELKGTTTTSVTPVSASTVATTTPQVSEPVVTPEKAAPVATTAPAPAKDPDTKVSTATTATVSEPAVTQATATPQAQAAPTPQAPVTSTGTPVSTPKSAPSGTSVTLDVDKKAGAADFDYSKSDNCHTYTVKPGKVFSKVVKGTTGIWEQKNNICAVRVIFVVDKDGTFVSMILDNYAFVLLKLSTDGKWTDITSTKHDITKLKFLGENDREITKANYKVTLVEYSYRFKFNEGVKCKRIKLGDDDVWKHSDDPKFDSITLFDLGLISNTFFVKNKTEFKKLPYKGKVTAPGTEVTAAPAPAQPKAPETTATVPAKATPVAAPSGRPVTLNISGEASTEDYDFTTDHHRNIKIYTAKGSSMFNKIFKDEIVIWTTNDPNKYSTKVFTDGIGTFASTKYVTIYLYNGQIEHYCKSDGGWQKASNKISLDLGKTSSTIGFDFHHDGERRTFTAKPGYLFKNVFLGGCISGNTFWDAKTDIECSSKVVVYGVESSIKNVNVFLNNDRVVHAHRVGSNWVSSTGFTLDIGKNSNNDLFDYRSTRGFGHFNPKANLSITNIVKKGLKIWSAKDRDYGLKVVLMGSGKDVKHLSILLESGKFVLLSKIGQGQPWKDVTNDKHNFSGVKMFSLEESTSKYHELTREDYEPIVFECRYGYEFRNDVRCVMIMQKDMVLWNHTEDTEFGYPKGFYLDLRENKFSVTSLKDQTKEIDMRKVAGLPGAEDIAPVSAAVVRAAAVTKVTLDIEKKEGTTEFDYSRSGNYPVFTAKSGCGFNKIMKGGEFVWEFPDDFGTLATKKGSDNVAVLLYSGNLVTLKKSSGKWSDISCQRHNFSKLKFYGDSDTELKPADYKVNVLGYDNTFTFTYEFNAGVNCKKVKYGDNELWNQNQHPGFQTKMIQFDPLKNEFYIATNKNTYNKIEYKGAIIPPDKSKPVAVTPTATTPATDPAVASPVTVTAPAVTAPAKPAEATKVTLDIEKKQTTEQIDYKDENGVITYTPKSGYLFNKVAQGTKVIWASVSDVFGKLVRTKETKGVNYLVVLLTNRTFSLFQEAQNEWKDITKERHDVKKLKFYGEGDTVLKETDYDVTIVDMSFSHTFKSGVNCRRVLLGQEVVWKSDHDPKFPTISAFSLGLASNCFFIKNASGDVKKIEPKVEAELVTKVTAAPVKAEPAEPVKPKEATPATAGKSISLDIETTKGTDQFDFTDDNNVKTFSRKNDCVFDKVSEGNTLVWESEGVSGTMVRTKKFPNGDEFLVILLKDYMFQLFQKPAGGAWKDVTGDRFDLKKLKFFGEGDKEITKSDYNVNLAFLSYEFIFKTGVKCQKVKLGDDVLWKHDEDPKFREIKAFTLGLTTNKFFVKNQADEVKKIEPKQTEVKVEETKPTEKVEETKPVIEAEVVAKVAITPVGTVPATERPSFVDPTFTLLKPSIAAPDFVKLYSSKSGEHTCKVEKLFDDYDYVLEDLQCEVIAHNGNCVWKHESGKEYPKFVTYKEDEDKIIVTLEKVYYTCFMEDNEWKSKITTKDKSAPIEPGPSYPLDNAPVPKSEAEPVKATEAKAEAKTVVAEPAKSPAPAAATGTTAATPAAQPKTTPPTPAATTGTTPSTTVTQPKTTPVTPTPAATTGATTTPAATPATAPVTTGTTTNQVTLDIAKNQSTNEIDYSKSDDNKYHKYAPKSGKVFSKVTQGNTQIWSSTGNVSGSLVRVRTEGNEKHVAIMLSNNGFKLFHSSDKGNTWADITSKRHDITKVKFYADGNKELKTPDYTVSLVDFAYRFTLKSGVKCKKIKHNNKDVWKSSDDNNYKVITILELGLVSNDFFVHKDENTKKKLNFK